MTDYDKMKFNNNMKYVENTYYHYCDNIIRPIK